MNAKELVPISSERPSHYSASTTLYCNTLIYIHVQGGAKT